MSTVSVERSSSTSGLVYALLGAVVSFVLSFLPLSPVLGGAVAGYLNGPDRNAGLKLGAVSGVILTIPLLLVGFAVAGLFFAVPVMGMAGGASPAAMGVPFGIGVLLLFAFLFGLVYTVGLSAVGGYLGAYLKASGTFE
jgi:hypothetical protein